MSAARDEARRKAEVMLAFAEGAEVECRDGLGRWVSVDCPTWEWGSVNYRVKPKPREAWVIYTHDGRVFTTVNTKDEAAKLSSSFSGPAVHMREVTE